MCRWRQAFKRMKHEECVYVCGSVGIPLPATLPRHCLHHCLSSPFASPVWVRDYITLISVTIRYVLSKSATSLIGSKCSNRKSEPPRPPRLQGTRTIYLSHLSYILAPGAKKDNVTSRSDNMPWYCGPTLIEVACCWDSQDAHGVNICLAALQKDIISRCFKFKWLLSLQHSLSMLLLSLLLFLLPCRRRRCNYTMTMSVSL